MVEPNHLPIIRFLEPETKRNRSYLNRAYKTLAIPCQTLEATPEYSDLIGINISSDLNIVAKGVVAARLAGGVVDLEHLNLRRGLGVDVGCSA